jgi:hypothetical protein
MQKRTTNRPLGYEPYPELAYAQMYNLVHALNGVKIRLSSGSASKKRNNVRRYPSDSQDDLRRLVRGWMESGPDLIKMFKKEPELERQIRYGRTRFYPVHDGRGYLDWISEITGDPQPRYKDQALRDFLMLITNPQWELLGGPCARCGDFFLKKTRRPRVYCTRKCSSAITAVQAVNQHRKKKHAEKIEIAQRAIGKYSEKKRRLAWKEWVSNQTGYTKRWITRAVNKGDLRSPDDPAVQ